MKKIFNDQDTKVQQLIYMHGNSKGVNKDVHTVMLGRILLCSSKVLPVYHIHIFKAKKAYYLCYRNNVESTSKHHLTGGAPSQYSTTARPIKLPCKISNQSHTTNN